MNRYQGLRPVELLLLAIAVCTAGNFVTPHPVDAQTFVDYSRYMSWVGGLDYLGARDVAISGDIAFVAAASIPNQPQSGLLVVDVSNRFSPQLVTVFAVPEEALAIDVVGDLVYTVHDEGWLRVFDVSAPSSPQLVGEVVMRGRIEDIVVLDDYAYLACGDDGFRIVDVSDPADPQPVWHFNAGGISHRVDVSTNYLAAYVANVPAGIQIFYITSPDNFHLMNQVAVSDGATAIDVVMPYAYAMHSEGLAVVDLQQSGYPTVATVARHGDYSDIQVSGGYAFAASGIWGRMEVFDISDRTYPYWIFWTGSVGTINDLWRLAIDGNRAYLVSWGPGTGAGSLDIIDVLDPVSPPVSGNLDTGGEAFDVVVAGDYAYIANGSSGLAIADVTSPGSPSIVHEVDTPGFAVEVAVEGDRVHVADSDGGLRIIDISVPESASEVAGYEMANASDVAASGIYSYVTAPPGLWTFQNGSFTDVETEYGPYYDLAVVGEYLYVAGGSTVSVYDLANPREPEYVSRVYLGRMASTFGEVNGANLCLTGNDGIVILEVSNPLDPQVLGSVDLGGRGISVAAGGSFAYVATYFDLKVIDVSIPTDPWPIGGTSLTSGLHRGVALAGDYVYSAQRQAGIDIFYRQWEGPVADRIAVNMPVSGPVAVHLAPEGPLSRLTSALQWDGVAGHAPVTVDATITVEVSNLRRPIPGIPADDIWLTTSSGGVTPCGRGMIASGPTDATGRTKIVGPLSGGGYSDIDAGEQAVVVVQGARIEDQPLDIFFSSVDNDGNLVVNLSDAGFFSSDLYTYRFRSDFYWDGKVNLTDAGIFAWSIGGSCRPAGAKDHGATAAGGLGVFLDRSRECSAMNVEAGQTVEVYLTSRGDIASQGVGGWECSLDYSDNLEYLSSDITTPAYNFAEAPEFIVGTGRLIHSEPDQPLQLATFRFRLLDDKPAHVRLKESGLASLGAGSAVIAIGEGRELYAVSVQGDDTEGTVVWINDDGAAARDNGPPETVGLNLHAAPNPFNPETEIRFNLAHPGEVVIRVYDVRGRLVRELAPGGMGAGRQTVHWDASDENGSGVASGIYFGRLFLNGRVEGQPFKMSVIK